MVTPLRRILHSLKGLAVGSGNNTRAQRRDFSRALVDTKVTVFFENATFEGLLRDISISGAMLEVDCGMQVGSRLELELQSIPGRVRAEVVRLTANGAGIRFSNSGSGVLIAGWSRGTSCAPAAAKTSRIRS